MLENGASKHQGTRQTWTGDSGHAFHRRLNSRKPSASVTDSEDEEKPRGISPTFARGHGRVTEIGSNADGTPEPFHVNFSKPVIRRLVLWLMPKNTVNRYTRKVSVDFECPAALQGARTYLVYLV